ncbi:hypothetical protein [Falsiroseomonas tokyonensis]|uniref:Uncharacterized protein n=1 Tax=Falsiroseomonas tokyonensis TaxID=430521 RepID=A0ABV7BSL0_9PROT|nr:hypothetical protein [Falsiroseomonas tokyonensis]
MADDDYVFDEATGEWRPASEIAAAAAPGPALIRDAAGMPWRMAIPSPSSRI